MENLVKEKHYNDMIVLFGYFQNRAEGLSQKHFRYALMYNEKEQLSHIEDMKNFFKGKEVSVLYRMKLIKKGSITSQKNLNYYLKFLLQKKIIKKVNNNKPFKYKLTPEFYSEYNKMHIRERIDNWDNNNNLKREYFFNNYQPSEKIQHVFRSLEGKEDWTLFGLSKQLIDMFTKEEINEITSCIKRVEENLWKITELKYKKSKDTMNELYKMAATSQQQISQKLDSAKYTTIDFYYHGMIIPEYND